MATGGEMVVTNQWESEILKFERADQQKMPDPGGVLFLGSSTIRKWDTLKEDFPDYAIIRRGFGGSQIEDSRFFADRIIIPYRPAVVVLYAGDNDITKGKSPEEVLADYQALVAKIHRSLPKTRIIFLSIKASTARWHLAEPMRRANRLIAIFSDQNPKLDYVDVFEPMLGWDGAPRPDLFLEDGLHLNREGYRLWTQLIDFRLSQALR